MTSAIALWWVGLIAQIDPLTAVNALPDAPDSAKGYAWTALIVFSLVQLLREILSHLRAKHFRNDVSEKVNRMHASLFEEKVDGSRVGRLRLVEEAIEKESEAMVQITELLKRVVQLVEGLDRKIDVVQHDVRVQAKVTNGIAKGLGIRGNSNDSQD